MFDDAAWKGVPNGGFDRGVKLENLYYATLAQYETGLPVKVIFGKPPKMKNILGDYVSALGLSQFRCAETEKYPHVTFFFNDYRDEPFPGEDRLLVPSPRDVTTYDQRPEMSARPVTAEMLRRVASGNYDLMVLNYANGDMVGHTGIIPAAVKAVETVDECVGKVVDAVLAQGGAAVVTADHGNCEQMIDPNTNGPHTAHTTYDVDLIVVDDRLKNTGTQLRAGGTLADIAPTLLALMGLPKPPEMTGESLVPAAVLTK
jgi:2,3-bisphosphoglycerate-independent phosphoglycerate mutase